PRRVPPPAAQPAGAAPDRLRPAPVGGPWPATGPGLVRFAAAGGDGPGLRVLRGRDAQERAHRTLCGLLQLLTLPGPATGLLRLAEAASAGRGAPVSGKTGLPWAGTRRWGPPGHKGERLSPEEGGRIMDERPSGRGV